MKRTLPKSGSFPVKKLKKWAAAVMLVCLVCHLSGCESAGPAGESSSIPQLQPGTATESAPGKTDGTKAVTSEQEETTSKALVVYFSATRNTESVAKTIAEIADAELYEIVPAQPYSAEDLDYGDEASRTSVEMNDPEARPETGGEAVLLDGYDTVYLGYPIWWGTAPRIMSTFVEGCEFDGKTVIPFCTSGGSGIGNSADTLEQQAGGGVWLEGRRFAADCPREEIQTWMDTLD
ncbi:flavodoxin [Allofournierella sp.]|uniref:flavodoxin n=1 Tax=Allofournierella sp. TaxID=1940256 RepID=UPI003AB1B64A